MIFDLFILLLNWFVEEITECLQEDAKHRPYVSDVINRLANYEGGVVPHFDIEDDDDIENTSVQKKKKKKKAKVVFAHADFCSYREAVISPRMKEDLRSKSLQQINICD